jgi:hypothetical protein
MGEKQGSKLMRSLYAAFYSGSITQLWPLRDWLDRTERQKLPGYTAATAEAEGASERAAALALKRDVVSTHWAWGGDGISIKLEDDAHDQLQPSIAQPLGIQHWFGFRCISSHDAAPTCRFRLEHQQWERVL